MNEYNWDDIIVNPSGEKARNCIGKECYYSDNPTTCLSYANSNYEGKAGILESIQLENHHPFCFDTREKYYCCIILKKEKPKVYVPFSSVDEFLSTYFEKCESMKQRVNAHNEDVLCNHGIWLKDKKAENTYMVTKLGKDGIIISYDVIMYMGDKNTSSFTYKEVIKWNKVLELYNFLDDTPCGKLYLKKEE